MRAGELKRGQAFQLAGGRNRGLVLKIKRRKRVMLFVEEEGAFLLNGCGIVAEGDGKLLYAVPVVAEVELV